ncbi:MAG: ABC transporter ATP-binding protein [Alphaproteobacteria bacterium]|nr:ABC transporter ATP-binding protein [Alphaproteobacteria bacterium]
MTRATETVVAVSGLRVDARDETGRERAIVRDIGFEVGRGEVVALIGESGSGKTTIALSMMGYARPGCRIAEGEIRVGGTDVRALDPGALAAFRGRRVTYIPQSAAAAFNPSHRLMRQVVEGAAIHGLMSRAEAAAKAVELFRALALPDPETIGDRYPHQVSGGQLQRLIAAMALLPSPELVILDEPTTALDVTTQIEVLRAFKKVVREQRTTALYVSHDLAVVAQMADRIIVLRDGAMQEEGAAGRLLTAPSHPYTQELLRAADPALRESEAAAPATGGPVLEVRDLTAGYGRIDAQGEPAIPVLRDISLRIERGSVLGVIGESGSGKSTLARVVAGLLPAARGSVELDGAKLPALAAQRTRDQLRRIQIVFQMADVALNPARTVSRILGRPLAFYHGLGGAEQTRRIAELLDMVRLPAALAGRHPDELSGGQKQRVNLARALAAKPDLILCDEVTSALDTVVGTAILELLDELRRELGVAYMFISHDLSTVKAICDQVMILYAGEVAELGGRQALPQSPLHPYTDLLISSVPELRTGWLDERADRRIGEAASRPTAGRSGCAFAARCPVVIPDRCATTSPPWRSLAKGASIRCHRSEAELLAQQSVRPSGAAAAPLASTPR